MSLDKKDAEALTSDADNGAKMAVDKNPEKKVRWSSLKRLMALSKPETGRIIVGLLALLVNGATNLSFPAILGQAVDKANDADYINQLGNTGLIFAVGSIASWLRIYCLGTSTERISCRLRKALFNCYMDKEIEFFDTQRDGELSIILEKDVPMAAETLTDKLAAGLRSLNSSINGSIMLFATSPELCGVTLTIVPLVGIAAMTLRKFTKRLQERSRELQGTVLTFALERYRRISTVRLNGQQEKEKGTYGGYVDDSYGLADSAFMAQGTFMSFLSMMTNVSLIAVLFYGGKLIARKKLTPGILTKFAIQSVFVGLGFSGLTTFYGDISKGLDAATRVFQVLGDRGDDNNNHHPHPHPHHNNNDNNNNDDEGDKAEKALEGGQSKGVEGGGGGTSATVNRTVEFANNVSPPRASKESEECKGESNGATSPYSPERVGSLDGKDAITISDLSFSYPSRPAVPVLDRVTLTIKKHSFVAIAGASGSGKSTLMSLICGLYTARSSPACTPHYNSNNSNNGNISTGPTSALQVYGKDIIPPASEDSHDYHKEAQHAARVWLQSCVAAVQQDIGLLSGTIEENILYGRGLRKQVSSTEVIEAAQSANAHEFITSLKEGYHTLIGDNGRGLSGGQRSRIALARALIKQSPILLLDEVTAALDNTNESEIIGLLKSISHTRTVVVFTHSAQMMRECDIVHVLDEGKVKCSGDYDALMKSEHAALVKTVTAE